MTKHRNPFRALAVLAGACAAVVVAAPVVVADEFPSTFHFDFFDAAPKKPVHHHHYVKKATPVVAPVVAPIVAPPAVLPPAPPVVTTSTPPATVAPVAAVPVVPVQQVPLVVPAGPSKADVEEVKSADPVNAVPAIPGDMTPDGFMSTPFEAVTAVATTANVGVNAVHAATGGGWKFVLAMVLIIAGGLGALRLAAVRLKGVYSATWNIVWAWVKWIALAIWWLLKQAGSYALSSLSTAYGKLLLRFEAWRAAKTATTATTTPTAGAA